MKKIISLLILIIMTLSLAACGSQTKSDENKLLGEWYTFNKTFFYKMKIEKQDKDFFATLTTYHLDCNYKQLSNENPYLFIEKDYQNSMPKEKITITSNTFKMPISSSGGEMKYNDKDNTIVGKIYMGSSELTFKPIKNLSEKEKNDWKETWKKDFASNYRMNGKPEITDNLTLEEIK